jgi:hypothetical protein
MKKVINLTESELINLIGRIVEDVDISNYSEEDFIGAFISVFKPWVIKNHGEELSDYPLSYLSKKYSNEFMDFINYPSGERSYRNSALAIGRHILQKELHSYKNLKQTTKFTEKFKAPMDALIKSLNLPDYLSLEIGEYEPYEVYAKINVDFPKLIKSGVNPNEVPRPTEYLEKLKKNVISFLGPKIGNAKFGELEFSNVVPTNNKTVDEWVKKVLNKEIKKKIKELPQAKENLHSIKFEPNLRNLNGEITLTFKQNRYGSNFNRNEFVVAVKKLLSDMGYSKNILRVFRK